jgi:hypothetical protein
MEKRRNRRYGLLTLALLTFAVLLVVPSTRWLLRAQFAMAFLPPREYAWALSMLGVKEDAPSVDKQAIRGSLNAAAERHSGQYDHDLAFAVLIPGQEESWDSRDVVAALRELEGRYPNASLYAHILRFGCMGDIRAGRIEEQRQITDIPPKVNDAVRVSDENTSLDEEKLHEYLEIADKGIAAEPDNAYFYVIRSILQFGLHEDEEALADIHRAAACPRYEDYVWEEADARLAMARAAFGEQSALTDLAQSAAILFPHYAQMRSSARIAVYKAIEAEKVGNVGEGIAIREDVMRLGSLMRRQSRSYIGALVGIAFTGIGRTRPGGVYLNAETEPSNLFGGKQTEADKRAEAQAQRKLDLFCAFLNDNARGDLTDWTRQEYGQGKAAKEIGNVGLERSVFGANHIAPLAGLWTANIVLLINAGGMLVFGGLALFLARRTDRPGRLSLCLFLGLFGVAAYLLVMHLPIASYFSVMMNMLSLLSSEPVYLNYCNILKGVTVAGALAIPALTLALSIMVSLICRVPVSTGVMRGFKGLGIPAACLLFLAYAVTLPMTLRQENRTKQHLQQMLQHEGRYLAELTGRTWPEQ